LTTKIRHDPIEETLNGLAACPTAVTWAKGQRTWRRAWANCDRGDWLLWAAERIDIDRTLITRAACDCARKALKYVPGGEERPRIAIETAEAWCRGEATIEEVRASADYADSAASASGASADAAASGASADAAASAASAAASASAYGAADASSAYAAYADASSAYADASAAYSASAASAAYSASASASAASSAATARTKSFKECASLVRKRIPWSVIKAALTKYTG
jgi:hypothetical protein